MSAPPVQLDALDHAVSRVHRALAPQDVQRTAGRGVSGGGGRLPHLERIQAAFGRQHDLSGVRANVGGSAGEACEALSANGYAMGNDVAFARAPSLELAAHEAAHVVQQRAGVVQLSGGVGRAGDRYEQQADAVAARVVSGQSAADLLPGGGGGAGSSRAVQRDENVDAGAPFVLDDKGGHAPAPTTAAGQPGQAGAQQTGDAAKAPEATKAGVEKSLKFGDITVAVKAGADGGEASIKGEVKKELQVPIMAGVFFQFAVGATLSGKAAIKADGSFEGTIGGELSGAITAHGGVPKLGSVYGGGQLKLPVNALKVSKPKDGPSVVDRTALAVKVALVVGAKIDLLAILKSTGAEGISDSIGSSWKVEWNPGGEVEIVKLVFDREGQLSWEKGKDFAACEAWVRSAWDHLKEGFIGPRVFVDPNVRLAGKTFADSIIAPMDDKPLPFPTS